MVKSASIAQARAELSALINEVVHGKERVVLTSRGRPKAALISLDDLSALDEMPTQKSADLSVLEHAARVAKRIRERQLRRGISPSDSGDDLAAIREGLE